MFSQFEGANETRTTGLFPLFPVHRPYLKDAQRRREDLVTFSFPKSITTDDHLLSAGCLPSFGNKLRRRLLGRRRLFQSIHNAFRLPLSPSHGPSRTTSLSPTHKLVSSARAVASHLHSTDPSPDHPKHTSTSVVPPPDHHVHRTPFVEMSHADVSARHCH
ncbi:transmembrane protein 68 [Striga asiatica]|uniref:Transmembrane protein 68 n=1 Tax=Striga asiatica TaxID=4170 RepID=A0A5A7P3U0_STRAF|nr:transmembrane protein 68 [Striga asiatica]